MDGRRRQWISWDVFFNDGNLGSALREDFGVTGMMVFNSFLCACKKNSVQGQISYTSEAEALAILGLPGLRMRNEDGRDFTLDELWVFLGRKKQVKRRRRGRITDVISTRWDNWQTPPGRRGDTSGTPQEHLNNAPGTQLQHTQNGRSGAGNAETIETIVTPENDHDIDPDFDLDHDREVENDHDPDTLDAAIALHHEQEGRQTPNGKGESQLKGYIERLANACTGQNPGFIRAKAIQVIAMCNQAGPELAIAAAIREAEEAKGASRLKLPQGLFPIFDRQRVDRGLPPLNLRLPEIGKRVSA